MTAGASEAGGVGAGERPRRLPALDGLRGLAALVVVVHHSLLVAPVLAAAYGASGPAASSGWSWWLVRTPLHLLWAGDEAVFVFFVLSGFVLALPFARGGGGSWVGYYPRRMLRLYVPVWASVALSLLCYAVVAHRAGPGLSWWTDMHAVPVRAGDIGRDAGLLENPGVYDSALWSLRWEVLFSLLLPLFVIVGRRLGRLRLPAAAMLLLVIGVGHVRHQPDLVYLPMFGLGVVMAFAQDHLARGAARLRGPAWLGMSGLAVALLATPWMVPAERGSVVLPVAGALLVLFLFIGQRHAVALGKSRPVQWLGRRSFSLYLVHEPLIVGLAFAFRTERADLVLLAGLPLSLAVAAVFYALVERPSHRLANAVGRWTSASARRLVLSDVRPGNAPEPVPSY